MTIPLLIFAAACGGALRFMAEYKLPPVGPHAFPRATLIVNIVGSFVLGIVTAVGGDTKTVIGVGLCGALTTFSGVSLQLHRRIMARSWISTLVYLAVTVLGGICAAWVGLEVGKIIF